MQIGILSDSHLTSEHLKTDSFHALFSKLSDIFLNVDHIIHAGDVVCEKFIFELEKIAPVSVVQGNMDAAHGLLKWPRVLTITLHNVSIGVTHSLNDFSLFDPASLRVFIYGHSHYPSISESEQGILMINPGSLTQPRQIPSKRNFYSDMNPRPSVALLNIEDGILSACIQKI